jgi:hypothetical protein
MIAERATRMVSAKFIGGFEDGASIPPLSEFVYWISRSCFTKRRPQVDSMIGLFDETSLHPEPSRDTMAILSHDPIADHFE